MVIRYKITTQNNFHEAIFVKQLSSPDIDGRFVAGQIFYDFW